MRIKSYLQNKLVLLIGLFGFINNISSQTTTIKLSDKLTQLEKRHNIHFSYNHSFFDTILLDKDFECKTVSECINIVQKQLPIKIERQNEGSNYIITPIRKDLSFQLIDNDTDEIIPAIEYQINDQPKQHILIEKGFFTIKNVFLLDKVHISSIFYKPLHLKAKDLLNNKKIRFTKQQFHLDEVIVNSYLTTGIDSKIADHSLLVKTEELGLLAGETDGDIFNVLKNIPGIHSPSGKPGNLNFRGNTFDQNLLQVDDIPIYHSGHFFGALSPYNTSVITNVEIQRNTLPVKWGGRVGGLINMTTSNKIPEKTKYEFTANTIFAGAAIKAKIIEDKLSLIVAGRTSYPSFQIPKLEAISNLIFQGSRLESVANEINNSSDFDIGFSDVNAKLNYKFNENHSFTVSFIDIKNDLFAEIKDDDNEETDFRELELDNWGITAKWKAQFSDKFNTELRFSKSNMNLVSLSEGFVLDERSSLQKYDNTISDMRLISEFNYIYNPNLLFEAGYTLTKHKLISNEEEQENNIDSKREQSAIVHSMYLSLQKNWNDKLTVDFGFHNNYYSPTNTFYVNPRFSTSYAVNNKLYWSQIRV